LAQKENCTLLLCVRAHGADEYFFALLVVWRFCIVFWM